MRASFPLRLLLVSALLVALPARAAEIHVSAAASLADALQELAAHHEQATGDRVRLNLAASSLLARQIKEGAPADLFFSADEARMDELARTGRIDAATRRSLLGNTLVIVIPADSPLVLKSARALSDPAVKHLALAEPQTVPAGIYAQDYLRKSGLWEAVRGKVVATENVRAALAAVESGNAEAGIVYKTDALISTKIKVGYEVPASEGPRITYPVALVKDARNPAGAAQFLARLASPEGRAVFVKFGFVVLP